jgi:hypothetical protein
MSPRFTGPGATRFSMVRLLGVSTVMIGAVAGCTTRPTVCAASAVSAFPFVQLNVSAWTRSHPQATVRACADTHCVSRPAGEVGVQIYLPTPPGTDPRRIVTITLTADQSGQQVLRTNTLLRLVHHTTHDPCGPRDWWTASATLTTTGRLQPG